MEKEEPHGGGAKSSREQWLGQHSSGAELDSGLEIFPVPQVWKTGDMCRAGFQNYYRIMTDM